MNEAQRTIYNMMIDQVRLGSRLIFHAPRHLGKTLLKKKVSVAVQDQERAKTFLGKFVFEKGRHFYPDLLPADISRGEVGDCFDYCLIQATKSKGKYLYCEGMAYFNGKWIHHAWLTDEHGYTAYDPTWKAFDNDGKELPLSMIHYLGAACNTEDVAEFVIKTGYKSPFANHEKNPKLAQKVYDSAH